MERTFTAVYEDGVLKPSVPLDLPPSTVVRLTVESWEGTPEDVDREWQELERSWDELSSNSGGPLPTRDELHDRH